MPSRSEGIRKRFSAKGTRYQATVWRGQKRYTKTFATQAEAKRWRASQLAAVETLTRQALATPTLAHYATQMLAHMRIGVLRTRSGDAYKPSALRAYTTSLSVHILPLLGAKRLDEITLQDVQACVNTLYARGLDPSTVRNATMPLRVAYQHAMHDAIVDRNPVVGVRLQAVRGRRERIATPTELAALIGALEPRDQIVLALAGYAGLRRGEIRALRWGCVESDVIRVEASWDDLEGEIAPKSLAGTRKVPIVDALRPYLQEASNAMGAVDTAAVLLLHRGEVQRVRQLDPHGRALPETLAGTAHAARSGGVATAGDAFVAPSRIGGPLNTKHLYPRLRKTWAAAGLEPLGLHEARHTFASIAISAGVNPKTLSTIMGHASIAITLDRYGHLYGDDYTRAAEQINDYLGASDGTR